MRHCIIPTFASATAAYGMELARACLQNATVVQTVEGANGAELVKAIELGKSKLVSDEVRVHSIGIVLLAFFQCSWSLQEKSAALTQRLKQLSTAAPIMLFMKGTPNNPRCKFSRATVELLAKYAAQYSTFDILSDPDVRAGLKTFSGWPTFPQLYVAGQFVGGLDIMKELDEEGELAEALEVAEVPAPTATAADGAAGGAVSAPAGPIEDRLKALIASSRVMLFMKGSPNSPQCGFSASAVKLLAAAGCTSYGHFDIFSDDAVRAGLKVFSNWPTYPQLYVDGELVGGLDILKELHEEGELAELLEEQ